MTASPSWPDTARPGSAAADAAWPDAARLGRDAWAEIDLDAIQANVRALIARLSPGVRFMAVVKADAYGHGAGPVARAAVAAGAWGLGVATVEEGVELRRAGLAAPVLILGAVPPAAAEAAVRHDLSLVVFQDDVVRAAGAAAARLSRTVRVHLKVDTGMGRIGASPGDTVALARALSGLPGVMLEGCMTHFAAADEPDPGSMRAQLETFCEVLAELRQAGIAPPLRHAANSAAALALPDAHLDLVRCGIAVYGVAPAPTLAGRARLRPAMRLCALVSQTKRVPAGTPIGYGHTYRTRRAATIATVPVGYADGYPRLAGEARGGGSRDIGPGALIRGERVPLAGRVSMDQLTVDAGDIPVAIGDLVELWGEGVPVEAVARAARTISYEILSGVSRRVPRVFVEGGRPCAVRTLLGEAEAR